MLIGILKAETAPAAIREVWGDYDALFHRLLDGHGFDFETFAVTDMVFPDAPGAADGWLITGSVHSAFDDLPWIAPLEAFIRAIHASGRPLVGVCFGHQIIAQALGGKVERAPVGLTLGVTRYEIDGRIVDLNAWHQDEVIHLPDGARVLGRSATCANAVLGYGDAIWTIQPHPEFSADFMDSCLRVFGPGEVPETLLAQAQDSLSTPIASAQIARHMAGFLKKERA